MADKRHLLVLRHQDASSIESSETRSILVARGRKDAASVLGRKPGQEQLGVEESGRALGSPDPSDPEGQYELGEKLLVGKQVPEDSAKAAFWFQRSAEQGFKKAMGMLFYLYTSGRGVTKDRVKAEAWLRKLKDLDRADALLGDAEAQYNVGFSFYRADHCPPDYAQAAFWYRKAADQGHARAQHMLGSLYDDGEGVPQDYAEGVAWHRKAAEQGDQLAQVTLGYRYYHGRGTGVDFEEAARWWLQAAASDYPFLDHNIGLLYELGQGVPQDYHVAAIWYRKGAEYGGALSQYRLGDLYYFGQGVPQDYEQAAAWYRTSAEQGYAVAQRSLGKLYLRGWGVPLDYGEAATWLRKAADQGDEEAQGILGSLYGDGVGVPTDYEEAYFWLRLCNAKNGDAQGPYAEFMGNVAENLSPSQLSAVNERATRWLSAHPRQA